MVIDAISAIAKGKARIALPQPAKLVHKSDFGLHLAYFGGVFAEGHGFYRWAALGLLVLSVVSLFVHDAEAA